VVGPDQHGHRLALLLDSSATPRCHHNSAYIEVDELDSGGYGLATGYSNNFTVTKVTDTVTYPSVTGISLYSGQVAGVTWSYTGTTINRYRVSLSTNGVGGTYSPLFTSGVGTGTLGSWNWTVPYTSATTTANSIKVEGLDSTALPCGAPTPPTTPSPSHRSPSP